jgi:hypothetical protein
MPGIVFERVSNRDLMRGSAKGDAAQASFQALGPAFNEVAVEEQRDGDDRQHQKVRQSPPSCPR